MKTCVFYGNEACPAEVKPVLAERVEDVPGSTAKYQGLEIVELT